jgi:hypothetical protein
VAQVFEGSSIVKKKIEGEQAERMARMESDLKKWDAEDKETAAAAPEAVKKD